jgi:MtrB/PioB family decaheme-associated outer membrane protein
MPFGTAINGFNTLELPAPVSYSTQNFSASAQYVGRLTPERHWSLSLAYNGSIFHNDLDSFTFDNPFRLSAPAGANTANEGRNSLPPSNESHRYTLTGAIDLPFSSRYVGTVSYSLMRQNEQFLPFTINPTILSSIVTNGLPVGTPMTNLGLLPAQSLNGEIEELLIDNLLTMRFGPHLTGTARLRHLDVQNNTPLLFFPEYVRADGARQNDDRQNYRPAYARTTASLDLNWRPSTAWSFGFNSGWERYDRDNRDADVTDEYTGRLFMDASPESLPWLHLRASVLQAQRRYENYDALNNVGIIGYPAVGAGFQQNPLLRKFDMADRDRTRVDGSAEFAFDSGLVITPSMSWRMDEYGDNLANGGELGLKHESYWNAGIEAAYPLNDSVNLTVSYLREEYDRDIVNRQRGGVGSTGIACPAVNTTGSPNCNWGSAIVDGVDTIFANGQFILSSNLELNLDATYSHTTNATDTFALGSSLVTSVPQFPDVTDTYQRIAATLKYNVGQELAQRLGWGGELTTELGYAYERNEMTNWATESMTPYMIALDTGANRSLFLDALNPNYEAHIVTLSLGFKW